MPPDIRESVYDITIYQWEHLGNKNNVQEEGKKKTGKTKNNIAVMITKKTTDHLALIAQVASSSIEH